MPIIVLCTTAGIKWGNYVGAPGNEPMLCWKHKHRAPLSSLVPLMIGDVFGLPSYNTLLLGYTKEKGTYYYGGICVFNIIFEEFFLNQNIAFTSLLHIWLLIF